MAGGGYRPPPFSPSLTWAESAVQNAVVIRRNGGADQRDRGKSCPVRIVRHRRFAPKQLIIAIGIGVRFWFGTMRHLPRIDTGPNSTILSTGFPICVVDLPSGRRLPSGASCCFHIWIQRSSPLTNRLGITSPQRNPSCVSFASRLARRLLPPGLAGAWFRRGRRICPSETG